MLSQQESLANKREYNLMRCENVLFTNLKTVHTMRPSLNDSIP